MKVPKSCRPLRPEIQHPHLGIDVGKRVAHQGGVILVDVGVVHPVLVPHLPAVLVDRRRVGPLQDQVIVELQRLLAIVRSNDSTAESDLHGRFSTKR